MSKHTPGPWKYCYLPQHRVRVVTADVSICDIALWTCDYEEQMANGLLIAAAPDLLEALKMVMQHGRIDNSESRMNQVASAIAAAEGSDNAPR